MLLFPTCYYFSHVIIFMHYYFRYVIIFSQRSFRMYALGYSRECNFFNPCVTTQNILLKPRKNMFMSLKYEVLWWSRRKSMYTSKCLPKVALNIIFKNLHIIISHTSLFLKRYYFWSIIISDALLFLILYYFWHVIISDTLLFLTIHYFQRVIIFHIYF